MNKREKTETEKLECNECDVKIARKLTSKDGNRYLSIGSTYIVTDSFTLEKKGCRAGHIFLCKECYDFFYRESVEDANAYRHNSRRLLKRYGNREEIDFDLIG